jgi:hypothetical protein
VMVEEQEVGVVTMDGHERFLAVRTARHDS